MSNSKGSSTVRSMMHNGKNPLLPPKSPFPSMISSSYTEYIPRSAIAPKPRGENPRHQRTSSESFLDEQPSWLDELLNEPDTPIRKGGHRRSSSDSFAYTDTSNGGATNYYTANDDGRFKNITPLSSSWGSKDIDFYRGARDSSFFYPEENTKNKRWDTRPLSLGVPPLSRGFPPPMDNGVCTNSGSVGPSQDVVRNSTCLESGPQDPKGSFDRTHGMTSALETDTKRTKQQYAQRSRVRKLQYIAELERNVQALQAEGSEASAELEFMNQRNLILGMENKTLKQRLDSLSQEKLIKCFEHEVLEKEAGRLQTLYLQQQQQQKQQPLSSSGHQRAKSRDLDQQFSDLSIKHKETGPAKASPSNHQLHI